MFRSIMLTLAFAFTLSFAVPQQSMAKERQVVAMATVNNQTIFCVFTYFYSCSGEYLGARADVYSSNGTYLGSYDYDEHNRRI